MHWGSSKGSQRDSEESSSNQGVHALIQCLIRVENHWKELGTWCKWTYDSKLRKIGWDRANTRSSKRCCEWGTSSVLDLIIYMKKIILKISRVVVIWTTKRYLLKYNWVECLMMPIANKWMRNTAIKVSPVQVKGFICNLDNLRIKHTRGKLLNVWNEANQERKWQEWKQVCMSEQYGDLKSALMITKMEVWLESQNVLKETKPQRGRQRVAVIENRLRYLKWDM